MRKSPNTPARARLHWDDLRIFVAVVAAHSINKAATELKITASNVARHLDELEARLDAKFLNRNPSGVTLTPAGEELYNRALSMKHFADEIERSVRSKDQRLEGRVTIGASDGIGSLWIAPRIDQFLSRNPNIQIALDLQVGPARDPANQADIVIALSAGDPQIGDDASELATMHYVAMASPRYIETYGMPKSFASAAGDHRTLRHTGQISQRDTWSPRAVAAETLANVSFETTSSAAFMSALIGGGGIGPAPTYVLTTSPELVIVGNEPSVPIKLWLIVRKEVRSSARVKRVAEWLKSIFDNRTNPWFRNEYVAPSDFAAVTSALSPATRETPPARKRRR